MRRRHICNRLRLAAPPPPPLTSVLTRPLFVFVSAPSCRLVARQKDPLLLSDIGGGLFARKITLVRSSDSAPKSTNALLTNLLARPISAEFAAALLLTERSSGIWSFLFVAALATIVMSKTGHNCCARDSFRPKFGGCWSCGFWLCVCVCCMLLVLAEAVSFA